MIFQYEAGSSRLHKLNPLSKFMAVAVFSIAMVLVEGLWIQICGLAFLAGIDYTIGSKRLHRCLGSAFVFWLALMIFIMQILFTPSGRVWVHLPLPFYPLVITDMGVKGAVVMSLRFINVILCGGIFSSTTNPVALVYSLMKAGVPYRYGFMVLMMLRFVPLFESERITISNAQKMRGLELDGGSIKTLFFSVRYTLLPLIVSTLSKTNQLVLSMEGRAFGYRRTRTFLVSSTYSLADKLMMAVSLVVLASLIAGTATGWLPLHVLKI
jgi:energy-coupling factor transport system permease protein